MLNCTFQNSKRKNITAGYFTDVSSVYNTSCWQSVEPVQIASGLFWQTGASVGDIGPGTNGKVAHAAQWTARLLFFKVQIRLDCITKDIISSKQFFNPYLEPTNATSNQNASP